VLDCVQRNLTSCHYTFITEYSPPQEKVCSDSYHEKCLISFQRKSVSEKVIKCYKPLKKVRGLSENEVKSEKICKTHYKTSCTSKYVEKEGPKIVGHSSCSRVPRVLCGQICRYEEEQEECHEKYVDTVSDTPEESCNMIPFKTCHKVTKLTHV
jgi:hypothetical protein